MELYNVKDEYIKYLQKFDKKVESNKSETRPYIGVVFEIHEQKYYAPFSSPKPKHIKMKNSVDFRKINNGKLGAINLNNMIPVVEEALVKIDIDNIEDKSYQSLLREQYYYIRKDEANIINRAKKLYHIYVTSSREPSQYEDKIKQRCCDFVILEDASKKYGFDKAINRHKSKQR